MILAKGDLIVGSAPGVAAILPVGADGEILMLDPAAPLGVRWGTPA
jgi:hypothetical protein